MPADDRATRGAKRARVLEEAAKALNRRGVSQTSLAEIAQRIGVSRAALYYYFEDQEDLVFQSYRRSCEIMARRLSEASHGQTNAMAVIEAFVDGMLGADETEFASLSEAAFLRPDQLSTIMGLYEAIMASLCEILEAGARRGELRACNTKIAAQCVLGLISWVPMARRWRINDPLTHAEMIDGIKEVLRYGVAADRRATVDYVPFELSSARMGVQSVFDAEALAAAKQEALLASASWLFNLKGVDATSLEEIALRVGVTKKVIYHNVGDKETLVVACYRRSFRNYEQVALRTRDYAGSRIAAFCASSHASAEGALREDIAPLAPLAGFEALPDDVRDEMHASSQRLMDAYLQVFKEGIAEGSMRADNPRAILAMHPGTFQWLPKWFDIFAPAEREVAARELADMSRLGLMPL
ncbi:MAG: TetR/AcrR family transcriptional regulator [Alphaproteobacteria bacterium]|nr:TetR/AcrR family transcriptional regulator [Alphaproteobacteria bacterium]MBU1516107.1 TetR/AcrR family transcriptional regulator [Alphaproteobacteria bacterium]MBU2092678.1 TetR/AcrR family transcriptional regulator [Alphaproteobacteria bacterium]MBU2308425.1 TetR/AcrR family transcriptional regulator [Alphaproteobacteria bacterium]MBU2363980.1 TetR/AcrR family transcriptional regulator [Alphaproteobacteria bacterium]